MPQDQKRVVLKAQNRTLPGFEATSLNAAGTAPFFFVQAADTQLGLISNWAEGREYPDEVTWEKEVDLCRRTVKILNGMRPRPAFYVVCGDLVDAYPDK